MARPVLSPGALRVHATALLSSIEAGRTGFVCDADLGDGWDVPVRVLELCVAGVWTVVGDGYRVAESEALRMVGELHRAVVPAGTAMHAH